MARGQHEAVLVRHGETDWSRDGKHTGRTDIPLNAAGRRGARAVGVRLQGRKFRLVVTSPSARAVETCRLAGFDQDAEQWPELAEWDYGDYEGRTTVAIQSTCPGWTIWRDGIPTGSGETIDQVAARADIVVARLRAVDGGVAVFAHGHFLRVLAARWLGLPAVDGRLFLLDPASISVLGYEHDSPAVRRWNESGEPIDTPSAP
jgi:broad specificity phosphatase PhoE